MYQLVFLVAALLLGGCQDKTTPAPVVELPTARAVATVYRVTSSTGNTACYRTPDASSQIVTVLRDQQLVDLVSPEAGMVQTGQDYWLHVYPRIGHRPACYIDSRNLVPVS